MRLGLKLFTTIPSERLLSLGGHLIYHLGRHIRAYAVAWPHTFAVAVFRLFIEQACKRHDRETEKGIIRTTPEGRNSSRLSDASPTES
jgi:hypothetical protein